MRLITIDNGNTNPHVGIFENEELITVLPLADFIAKANDYFLISDVGSSLIFKPSFDLKTKKPTTNSPLFFDMPVDYSVTLGEDRLFSAYWVFKKKQALEKVLLIDAGTFITMDIISDNGFMGGYIFPGINTFLSSYKKGVYLQNINTDFNFSPNDLPHSTEEALMGALNCYIDSVLMNIIKKTSPDKIIITGGSLELIKDKILKLNLPKVQLETYPHLIHSSLLLIFQYHLRPKDF